MDPQASEIAQQQRWLEYCWTWQREPAQLRGLPIEQLAHGLTPLLSPPHLLWGPKSAWVLVQ